MAMFIKPCNGPVTSLYSDARLHPKLGIVRSHWGIDYGGHADDTIIASASGKVRVANRGTTGFGNYIIIAHTNGWETLYAHLSAINVSVGQSVSQGQKIGVKGTTGNSTGVHLHFEMSRARWSNKYSYHVNPAFYIDDPDVRSLQQSLNKLGYKLVVDGHYGDATFNAVFAYQKANGLKADGAAGRITMASINKKVPSAKNGWVKSGANWTYLVNGVKKTGWLKDKNKWYYLKADGIMATGWAQVGGKWYYLNESGAMLTGWVQVKGKWYLLDDNGAMYASTCKLVKGKWYCFNSSGAMYSGSVPTDKSGALIL